MSLENLTDWAINMKSAFNQESFDEFLANFIVKYGKIVLGETAKRTPVDTGDLRKSWELGLITPKSVEIKNDEIYASFVEYGTINMDGFFMMTVSIDEVSKVLPGVFHADFEQFLIKQGVV